MFTLVPLVLAAVLAQDSKKPVQPPDDDEVVRGLPDGEIRPVPAEVNWNLQQAIVGRTMRRERIDLAGLWRFAAVAERESPVTRAEMGWIKMPGLWTDASSAILDVKMQSAGGRWGGKPVAEFPFGWVERDLVIRNDDAIKWLNHRIFLVLRGPWANAEVVVSQRFKPSRANDADRDVPQVHVNAERADGVDRDGARFFDITEHLTYPYSNQISLRLAAPKKSDEKNSAKSPSASAEPLVGLEMWPTGPRVDAVRLQRDGERGELVATIDIVRPKGFMLIPGPPVKAIPMTLKLRLSGGDGDIVLRKLDRDIGPIADTTRSVTVRMPLSAENAAPPVIARLRVRLDATDGGTFDEAFPVEFKPAELEHAD